MPTPNDGSKSPLVGVVCGQHGTFQVAGALPPVPCPECLINGTGPGIVYVGCSTCGDVGWLCAGTDLPADFKNGTCCNPQQSEEFALGDGCPSANGCPDCARADCERGVPDGR